jgi:hypothetical protein
MATIILENLPDNLVSILQQAVEKPQTPLKFLISPEIDPTWEERRKATPKILAEIRSRRHVNPADFGLPDSTELIREDRDR